MVLSHLVLHSLAKKINKKVMGMIEKAEEYIELLRKRKVVENDKRRSRLLSRS
jgi:hypothetical protein